MRILLISTFLLCLFIPNYSFGKDCTKNIEISKSEKLCISQQLIGEEFILEIVKIKKSTNKTIKSITISNVYAVFSEDKRNILFCTLANGWMSINSFSILNINKFSLSPLKLNPEPVDEVVCRFDASNRYVLIYDGFPARNNAYIYSINGVHVETIKTKIIDKFNIANKFVKFTEGVEFGGAGNQ